jgi:hypothetical protein
MTIASFDLELDQYADFTVTALWQTQASPGAPALPVNMSGCAARLMTRTLPTDISPLLSLTTALTANGQLVIHPNGNVGQIQINISKVATAGLPTAVRLGYDLLIDFPSGITVDLLRGIVFVSPGNTH